MIQFFLDSSQFIISGVFVGLLVGMTGVGGGSLRIPAQRDRPFQQYDRSFQIDRDR